MFSENFLPSGPISMILFLFYLRGGPTLIWSSSDDRINDKIKEITNSYYQLIEIIMNKMKFFIKNKNNKKKKILKRSIKTERIFLFMN